MCGILGAVGSPAWVSGLRLDRAVGAMAHRGPDGSGIWRSPSLDAPGGGPSPACVFGHTRLSIIDLSGAATQPMSTADGRYTLVYNGEIYNFREIRDELEAAGESVSSSGDTEVLLKAFVRFGGSCAERLRGMFAFAVWDDVERTLVLCRDRLGIKPLYYLESPRGLAFASEVRSLLAAGAASRVLSPRSLFDYLRFGSVQEPDTLIEGVLSLSPGEVLRRSRNGTVRRRYWTYPTGQSRNITREEAVESLQSILRETVRLHLVSDVPFGVFLSGGVDSSALAALASAEAPGRIHTFTVAFDEPGFSEERPAAATASRYGCTHQTVRITGADAARTLPDVFRAQDQPSGDGLNSYLVSRAARDHGLTVALSGLGGDEMFAGYRNFRLFGRFARFSRGAAALPTALVSRLERILARPEARNTSRKIASLVAARGDPSDVYSALRRLFTDAQIALLSPGPALRRMQGAASSARPPSDGTFAPSVDDPVNLFSRLETCRYLRNTLLRDTDSMSMANSIEVRLPFLDHRLLEFVASVPGALKLDPAVNKRLLVSAVGSLPDEAGRSAKVGFVLPLPEWFRGPLRPQMEELLLGLPDPSAGIMRRRAVEAVWRAFLAGDTAISASRVWALTSLAAWTSEHDLVLPW